jgi:hypothetical protein
VGIDEARERVAANDRVNAVLIARSGEQADFRFSLLSDTTSVSHSDAAGGAGL